NIAGQPAARPASGTLAGEGCPDERTGGRASHQGNQRGPVRARTIKEQAAMRRTRLPIITLAVAVPPAAQSQQKIVFMSGDPVITIERGKRESCAVKVGDRSLSARQAESLCEQKGRTVTSN